MNTNDKPESCKGSTNEKTMSTFTQILYQIVFSTKNAEGTMVLSETDKLYKYMWGIIKNKKCTLYRINGTENHLHIVTHIHPTISVSSLVKEIKVASSIWIKEQNIFPNFVSWQEGYGAFTYHVNQKERLVNYVKNQREHHKRTMFKDEYKELLKEHGVEYDEKYLI